MSTKICKLCGIEKPLELYPKNKLTKDGRLGKCKECLSKIRHEYYTKNREKIISRVSKWVLENKDKAAENKRRYYDSNKEECKDRSKEHYQKHREKRLEYAKKRYESLDKEELNKKNNIRRNKRLKEDIQYKLQCCLRNRVREAIKTGAKVGSAVGDLGCSIDDFKIYIEQLFQPGMNWENWHYRGWHLDHIIPLANFNLTNRDQFLKATHYTNYKPMWAVENMSKGSKVSSVYGNIVDKDELPKSYGNKFNTYLQDTLTKDKLVDLIVYKRMKSPQICKELHVTTSSLSRYIKMFHLSTKWHIYYNTEKLKELCDLGLSCKQIGELLNLTRTSVKTLLRNKGLNTSLKSIGDIKDIEYSTIDLTGLFIIP